MRDLPRQLTVEELAELFEGRTRFVERLAELDDPLGRAREVAAALSDEEKKEVLDAHPAIGAKTGSRARSAAEQGTEEAPELEELNRRYEERFGFRFVVFVNRRPKSEIVPILRERLERTREQELATALDELVLDRGGPMAALLVASSAARTTGGAGATSSSAGCTWSRRSRGSARRSTSSRSTTTSSRRRSERDAARGVGGEVWEIHGGGFYRIEKFKVAPERLPEKLYWFKWEAYTTWLSGLRADHGRLLRARLDVPRRPVGRRPHVDARRSLISIGGLALAWLVYDGLCRAARPRRAAARGRRGGLRRARRLGRRPSSSRRGPRTSRSARCSGRSWPRTSSS